MDGSRRLVGCLEEDTISRTAAAMHRTNRGSVVSCRQEDNGDTTHATGQAAFDFHHMTSLSSFTSSSKTASSYVLSHDALAPGLLMTARRSQMPTPTKTASAR